VSDLRVVQWATGNIGTRALKAVIEHPALDLVGLYVYADDKAGRDAGTLCGLDPVGVTATTDVDEIVALAPDCVLYTPRQLGADEVCRLLAAGIDVVTTRGEFHHPASMDPGLRERVETACAEGRSSVHSTGSSPGFITEAVPIVLTSIQRRLDRLTIDEFADLSRRDSPDLLFTIMGFGRPAEAFSEARLQHGRVSVGPSLRARADALGLPLDDVEAGGEVAVASRDVDIAAGTIGAGTVAAQRLTVAGMRNGRPWLRFRANWYCTTDLDPAWDLLPTGWRVSVEGDTPLEVDLRFPFPIEQMAEHSPGYTAHRAVNAVRDVCAAPPGILTTADLPQVIAALG
jgi:4-hydroxy-tetrahydrodipicolinate reductase